MNIFVLHSNPRMSALYLHDKHIVKMTLETAQILCSAYSTATEEPPDVNPPYKSAYQNHPAVRWARLSRANFKWLVAYGKAVSAEYSVRFKKKHASGAVIEWCGDYVYFRPERFPKVEDQEPSPPPLCMPDEYKVSVSDPNCTLQTCWQAAIDSYHGYYKSEKITPTTAKWTGKPDAKKYWEELYPEVKKITQDPIPF